MNPKGGVKKLASSIVMIALIVALLPIPPSKAQAASSVSAFDLIELTNSSRASAGLPAYSTNSKLASSANMKANDILDKDYFAHTSPQGASPWSWFDRAGYTYSYAGENLAIDFFSASGVHDAWMNSDSHRANILDRNFTEIGIAVVSGEYQSNQTIVIVEHFGRPKNQAQVLNSVDQTADNPELASIPEIIQTEKQTKNSEEILAESKIEILIYPQKEIALSIYDFLFPPLVLIKKLV